MRNEGTEIPSPERGKIEIRKEKQKNYKCVIEGIKGSKEEWR